jgi:hypothetical protein
MKVLYAIIVLCITWYDVTKGEDNTDVEVPPVEDDAVNILSSK